MSALPKGWADTKLGNTISLNYGKSLPATVRDGGQFAVFGSNGIVGHHSVAITAAPAIVVGRKGSFGEVHFSEEACFPIDTTYYVDTFTTLDARFAFHLLRHLPLTEMNRASAIPGLNREDAYGLDVGLPPLPEQRRIVAKVDELTARTARARKELDRIPTLIARYKSAVLALAFSGRLTQDWRIELEREAAGDGEYPNGWAVKDLEEISEIQGGIQVGKKRPESAKLVEVPYLRVANVQRGWLNLDEIKTLGVTAAERDRLLLEDGDILMNEGGDRDKLGRGWVWHAQIPFCIHQNHVFRIRLYDKDFPPEYVSHYANENGQRYFIDQGTQTTNLASISKRKVAALPVPIPPTDEAVEILRRIDSAFGWLDRVASDHAAAARLLPKLDAAILAKAFRGELVPQGPNDEPARVLLERVKSERAAAPKAKRGRKPRDTMSSKDLKTMAKNLEEVLTEAGDWVSAQDAFQRCGIGSGATTEDIEQLYAELRKLDKTGRLEAEPVNDDQGRKLHDRLRLKAA